jgi:hypothetical protein
MFIFFDKATDIRKIKICAEPQPALSYAEVKYTGKGLYAHASTRLLYAPLGFKKKQHISMRHRRKISVEKHAWAIFACSRYAP